MARTFLQFVESLERLHAQRPTPCAWRPPADVYRTQEGWLIKFDLAGVDPREVQLVVDGPRLTISGVRRDALVQEGLASYSLEISYNRFERTLELPFDAEQAPARTEYRDGMLLIWLQDTNK
jgi:HSP20 family protein